ncbi:hypothetical protein SAMN05519103_01808 [Rhizobiales bacterium GAS113]|nr:hypothetical protein SAMN05519103_01808 [Rhizobiales bacterium GAS113]
MKSKHKLAFAGAVAGAVTLTISVPALPHAIVGDRVFPVTLAIDDPGVADEVSLPTFARFKNADGSIETDIAAEFDKRITENFGVSFAGTWTHVKPGGDGFQNFEVGFKSVLYTNAPHEFMLSAGVSAEIGGTGAKRVGAESFSRIRPQVFFGKGFGDLPESVSWLRPIALTGLIGLSLPDPWNHKSLSLDPSCVGGDSGGDSGGGSSCSVIVNVDHHPVFLRWGLTLQYSLPYMNAHVREINGPEFLRRLTPIVEASFRSPVANNVHTGQQTTGTINPGIIYSGDTYQVAIEAMIPVNKASGKHVGVIAQLHFFLDDIFPNSLGKPIFSEH